MSNLPTGTVTFLFTDIEGSTKLAQEHPDKWESLRERHHAILQSAMDTYNGYVFQIIGDAFCVAFHTATDALNAAVDSQRNLQSEEWNDTPIKVRMGIHTGKAELQAKGDYHGYLTMAFVQRVMSVAHGGQILLSNTITELIKNDLPRDVTLHDLKDHRLKSMQNVEHLWQVLVPGLRENFPPLASQNTIPNNLPAQLNSFIGREKDVREIKKRLLDENSSNERLHTLTGMGGVGKTRLALQVASEVLDRFKSGVWFVELAPIRDVQLVPKTIAKTLGLSEIPGRSVEDVLKDYLREKKLLLILDNFEQVIDAASMVRDLLLAAPRIKIIATSRTLLRIAGEQEYVLPLLSAPGQDRTYLLEQLAEYESVNLFIERARLIRSDFMLTADNADTVAKICCRLDGLPLAIELAAANVRILSAQAILSQLDQRMNFLKSRARDLTPRQQTLRGAIDWGYELLTPHEQALFRRFSVFAADTNLETIETICGMNELDVFDLTESLVGKSLLKAQEKNGEMRFAMLELLKEYGTEKLKSSHEAGVIQERHFYFFNNHIQTVEPELLGANQVAVLDRLDQEMEDIRAAIQWARANHQIENLLEILGALRWFWQRRGNVNEAIAYLQDAIHQPGVEDFQDCLAKALNCLALLFFTKGDYNSSISMFERGISIARRQGNTEELACGLIWQCTALMRLQKFDESRASVNEGLESYKKLGQKWGQGMAHFIRGRVELESGASTLAEEHLQQSVLDFQETGDLWGQALSLNSLGSFYLQTGKLELAREQCEKSLALREQMRDQWGINSCCLNLGDIARLQNSASLETYYYRKSYELGLELGLEGDLARAANCLGYAALHSGNLQEASTHFSKSLNMYRKTNQIRGTCECLAGYASLATKQGKMKSAVKLLGATDALLKSNNIKMWRVDQTDFDNNLGIIHGQLDGSVFSTQWIEGTFMTMEQAIEYALELTHA